MALASQEQVSDGTMTFIDVGIQFFEQDDIAVYLDANATPLVEGTAYSWTSATRITFLAGYTPVPNGVTVTLRRTTKGDAMYNIYDGGAPFTRTTLDENFQQLLFRTQEYEDNIEQVVLEANETAQEALDLVENAIIDSSYQLRLDLADQADPAKGTGLVGYRGRALYNRLSDKIYIGDHGAVADGVANDTTALQAAITRANQSGRPVDLAGKSAYSSTGLVNAYGVPFENGKLLIPSLISGYKDQFNTYADKINGVMVGIEKLYAFRLACAAKTVQTVRLFGDSTVETGVAFPVKPHDLVRYAMWSAGISNVTVTNHGVAGTSWSDLNALGLLGTSVKLISIKFGINDAAKANPLATMAADARAKLTAIRANANGGVDNLSILLMGPNSTYRPSQGQDAKWYEQVRNLYLQLAKEFDCAYFDTYAYLQQTKDAPDQWLDNTGGGEGLHPSPIAVYWIWWQGWLRHVLEDGYWSTAKTNHHWNIGLATGTVTTATNPQDFPRGKSYWLALTANGWPIDGVIEVTGHADGITEMRVFGQQVVPITIARRGQNTVWTQWTQVPTAMTFLNGWSAKGGGYTTPRWLAEDGGWISLEGAVTGGTLGVSCSLLPTGARPASAKQFLTAGAAGAATAANVTIFSDGNVIVYAAANTTISLDGIRYRALG